MLQDPGVTGIASANLEFRVSCQENLSDEHSPKAVIPEPLATIPVDIVSWWCSTGRPNGQQQDMMTLHDSTQEKTSSQHSKIEDGLSYQDL